MNTVRSLNASNPHRQSVRFEVDVAPLEEVDQVYLKGSFDPATGEYSGDWNGGRPLEMRDDGKGGDRKAGDRVFTRTVELAADTEFQWGAVDEEERWLVPQEGNLSLHTGHQNQATYAPISFHRMGLQKGDENALTLRTWAPDSQWMRVEFLDDNGELLENHSLTREGGGDYWSLKLEDSWGRLEGKNYRLTSDKGTYIDPHARHLQGQQRGLERIFVDPVLGFETGWYDDSGKGGPNYADNPQWGRFVVDDHTDAEEVRLVLKDEQGRRLSKNQLLERLGAPEFKSYEEATEADRRDVDVLRSWQLAESPTIHPYVWTESVGDDGSISMRKWESHTTGGGWVTAVNNFPNLVGLSYEFEVIKDGQLVGDRDGNGTLNDTERRATPFNEPQNRISLKPSSARAGKVWESRFEPRYQDAPRMETDSSRFVIYEAHVGSFLTPRDHGVPATFEDMIANLDYLADLGVNALEVMPTQEFGGKRDWGYTPDHYFAGSEAYGFEMEREQAVKEGLIREDEFGDQSSVWVNGTDALKFFVDQAHKRGFQVLGDVVYNHTSGKPDGDNPLHQIDGDSNSFFRWPDGQVHNTPWGAKPDFSDPGVKKFFSDHATSQILEYGFDGLRFDFTQVLHNTGDAFQQIEGMNTLREINRAIDLVRPEALTVAEDFSGNWLVAADYDQVETQWGIEKKGMGFDRIWNDRFRDDTFEAAHGGSMDRLMDALTGHHGVSGWDRGVLYSHSHDEVGNSGEWIGRAAGGGKSESAVMSEHARGVARTAAALTLLGPGVPMLWQGEEFLANNDFKHGLTSTWGQDVDWLHFPVTPELLGKFERGDAAGEVDLFSRFQSMTPEQKEEAQEHALRAGHHRLYRELIALRGQSGAFSANGPVRRVYTHNEDKVMAFSRQGDDGEYIVVANFSDTDRHNYSVNLPEGRWREVFNSNSSSYGGDNVGNGGSEFGPGQGLIVPGSSALVLKKIG